MKITIIYESTHHGNTKKLVDAIAEKYEVDTVSIENADGIDLSKYDLIGFASGIAFGKFYNTTEKFAREKLPERKKVFFLYTCGKDNGKYANSMEENAKKKNCEILGIYGCPGYDTFGPFKLVGGIGKGHPNESDIQNAVEFFKKLL